MYQSYVSSTSTPFPNVGSPAWVRAQAKLELLTRAWLQDFVSVIPTKPGLLSRAGRCKSLLTHTTVVQTFWQAAKIVSF